MPGTWTWGAGREEADQGEDRQEVTVAWDKPGRVGSAGGMSQGSRTPVPQVDGHVSSGC